MPKYNPGNFDQEKYKRTGWRISLCQTSFDGGKYRLICNVATGRKYWCLFSEIVELELGDKDNAIQKISASLLSYTFPLVERFILELEEMLSDLYECKIVLVRPEYVNYINSKK